MGIGLSISSKSEMSELPIPPPHCWWIHCGPLSLPLALEQKQAPDHHASQHFLEPINWAAEKGVLHSVIAEILLLSYL